MQHAPAMCKANVPMLSSSQQNSRICRCRCSTLQQQTSEKMLCWAGPTASTVMAVGKIGQTILAHIEWHSSQTCLTRARPTAVVPTIFPSMNQIHDHFQASLGRAVCPYKRTRGGLIWLKQKMKQKDVKHDIPRRPPKHIRHGDLQHKRVALEFVAHRVDLSSRWVAW